jgi:hypothetical protein
MESEEKSTSERFADIWAGLGHNQRRFVIAMLESKTKREAAESIGVQPNTAYKWNGETDVAIELARADLQSAALAILHVANSKAAAVKVAGLDSGNESIRQGAASEILDRNLGKATQRQEITGKDGEPVGVVYITENRDDDGD